MGYGPSPWSTEHVNSKRRDKWWLGIPSGSDLKSNCSQRTNGVRCLIGQIAVITHQHYWMLGHMGQANILRYRLLLRLSSLEITPAYMWFPCGNGRENCIQSKGSILTSAAHRRSLISLANSVSSFYCRSNEVFLVWWGVRQRTESWRDCSSHWWVNNHLQSMPWVASRDCFSLDAFIVRPHYCHILWAELS